MSADEFYCPPPTDRVCGCRQCCGEWTEWEEQLGEAHWWVGRCWCGGFHRDEPTTLLLVERPL